MSPSFRQVHRPPLLPITNRFSSHQYCLRCVSTMYLIVMDDLLNAVVCFQPPSLLIGKVWVAVMHFCACPIHCKVHGRVGRRLGSCRLISVQTLIRSTSIGSALWVLEVLCCLYWHSFGQTDHSELWWMVVGVNWLTLCQQRRRAVFWAPLLFLLYTSELFSILENKLIGYDYDSTLMAVVPSPGIRVTEAESLIRGLGRVSEWCDLWGMKLNTSKTKTMIVSRSRTMYPQSPPLTIDGTVLKESYDQLLYWE